ncbi:uncharacterized protein Z518_05541 [Rhinocladiella mackenziei CBS 650.93]|uniref:Rhinocladiella mackenziei CBS 650.93 unplaced genomic scaffold supercont1.4, whole genome shotgun sequence n=1 Tax=Rhinocladiella mackenziei CBS 650.93 TaxID=1442369 RepID=A0A0D2INF9_9EURO|nr:uncharacterized protein Z518_05541 [Rhinocladiella mackenziei CBS 650.93]KIX04671.1 hypothetical protein Z518_05541 [Rhinocladiella mackenziei CBS 650.93]
MLDFIDSYILQLSEFRYRQLQDLVKTVVPSMNVNNDGRALSIKSQSTRERSKPRRDRKALPLVADDDEDTVDMDMGWLATDP